MKKLLLLKTIALVACLSTALIGSAYSFYKDGIYYNKTSSSTVEVTGNFEADASCGSINSTNYSGAVIIPRQVTYSGVTYTVNAIGEHAFKNSGISYLTIPSTVQYIDYHAFELCQFYSIKCYSTDPGIMSTWGWGSDYGSGSADCLYVLPGVLSDYQDSYKWKGYCRSIEALDVVMINSTNFPDANFRNYLLSLYPDGYLTEDDIANRTALNVASKGIANMKGIEFFTALKELRCWNNSFTSLNLNSNTELTYLDCAPNSNLSSLSISSCSKLQTVYCYSNALTYLDVTGKSNLTRLDCHNCYSLKTIYCYSNDLTNLDVSGCTALKNLQCYYNYNLESITGLADCTAITYLDCEDCAITNLSAVNSMNNLEKLYCRNNKITSLTVTNKSYLNYIRASGNTSMTTATITGNSALTTLNIYNCTALQTLYCYANNQVSTLNVTGNSALKDLRCYGSYGSTTALTTLDLTGTTALTSLDCGNLSSLTSITNLANCTAMKSFLCQNTAITSLDLDNMSNLEYLNCSNTKLTSLTVTDKSKLTTLNCSNNPQMTDAIITGNSVLTSLSFQGCTQLDVLDCSKNALTSLNITGCTALQTLNCTGNTGLSSFTGLNGCYNLTMLNFGNCNFSSFNPSSLTSLQYLYCFNNNLSTLNVSDLEDLVLLSCGDNNLTTLNLSNNYSLSILGCANNRLTSLNLSNNTDLQNVTCDGNQLTSINVQGLYAMSYLNCANNKLASLYVQGCNALYYIKCDQNKISGSGMTTLVNSLRNRSTTSQGYLLALYNTNENNAMTAAHVATVTAKNWIPYYYTGNSWEEYNPYTVGDVDGNGSVNIADVTALIDILLNGGTAPTAADVDGNGVVNIADVTALIDLLLNGNAKGAKLINADLTKSIDLVEQQLRGIK